MGAEPNSTARALEGAAREGRRCFPQGTAGTIPRQVGGFYFPVALFGNGSLWGLGEVTCSSWKPKQQLALEGKRGETLVSSFSGAGGAWLGL